MTEQEKRFKTDNPTKYEQIQFKISEAGSKVKDEKYALQKKIGIGFGIMLLVFGLITLMVYFALQCEFRNIDCGENGQCENMFNDYSCSCGKGAIRKDEQPRSSCIIDHCYGVDCNRGECKYSLNDYYCECESGLRFIDSMDYTFFSI